METGMGGRETMTELCCSGSSSSIVDNGSCSGEGVLSDGSGGSICYVWWPLVTKQSEQSAVK
jgi:hypothetical protein